jgi:putative oxidoreductase
METVARYAAPFGRILLALIFIASAFGKFADWQMPLKMMTDKGVPKPEVLLPIAVAFELAGGLSVAAGFYARVGGLMLLAFLIPVSYFMHDFWNYEDAAQRMEQMINFMKNVSIMGGALLVIAFGSGVCSIDHWRAKASSSGQPAK